MTDRNGERQQVVVVVRVEPVGADLQVAPGETIIEAAWRHGYHWPTTCHGQATCTICRVEVLSGTEHLTPVGADEQDVLANRLPGAARLDLTRVRLACRAGATGRVTVLKKGVRRLTTVHLPPADEPPTAGTADGPPETGRAAKQP
ncbi:(2Fe-2S)-binding protein [Frankia sp. Cpl3]|uniref:2Fe-2S iron-sulfur cluster-binding protein n=1 Tax=Parafrankia colletiae TaxID=573497 RepID=UPI000A018E37|nr:2Fe-2S iron-sulfur cluster-binding protein [Parafrankia colletiae]MCK9900519.1 (2Fe-2S)-binding protein [Frankia sp. Cpl3]